LCEPLGGTEGLIETVGRKKTTEFGKYVVNGEMYKMYKVVTKICTKLNIFSKKFWPRPQWGEVCLSVRL